MGYLENPKTKESGIFTAIPQRGKCPMNCDDCFFQSGRSYLEPLLNNLPNLPPPEKMQERIIRVNDGLDSNINRMIVEEKIKQYKFYFFNTSIPMDIEKFSGPVVLTINPGKMTDSGFHRIIPPSNLMFVRIRTNTWNLRIIDEAVTYYSSYKTPIVLTFMAYFTSPIPAGHQNNYIFRKRTINNYWAITTVAWREIMRRYEDNMWVYSCGKIEGERGITACARCGNCIREYFVTLERISPALISTP